MLSPDDQAPAATREFVAPEYGDVEFDGETWPGLCLRCWARNVGGERFIHPSWLRIIDREKHNDTHRTWLDLTEDEKIARVADALGGKIREEQPDGSWRTITAEEIRFA